VETPVFRRGVADFPSDFYKTTRFVFVTKAKNVREIIMDRKKEKTAIIGGLFMCH
jgi:hypothetical protein